MSRRPTTALLNRGEFAYTECQVRHDNSQHRKKSRASHVCQGCRKRKVKCDLLVSGNPCSNCREDDIACVALESMRSRKHRLQKHELGQGVSTFQAASQSASEDGLQTPEIASISHASIRPINGLHQPLGGTNFHNGLNISSHRSPSQTKASAGLPSYVKSMRPGFDTENAAFLASRGALMVPDVGIRDELIRCFVLYVHPYVPVFNLQDFFDCISQTERSNSFSLMLLQAVLYAGSAYVDMPVLEALGFQSRIAARKAFYIKVKQLYEFDWEEDPIPVIQALLLITDWFESPDDQKEPWYWLGVCLLVAKRIGLGNDGSCMTKIPKNRGLLKRLWWMCIVRDRVIAVATRKPLQFQQGEINTSLLTIDDFETQPINTGIALLQDCEVLTDPGKRLTLARLCIEKVNVSGWVARILSQNYSPGSGSEVASSSVMLYSPNPQIGNMAENIDLHRELEQWAKALPADCVFELSSGSRERTIDDEVLYLHRGILHMFSLMVCGLLYRPLLSARMNPIHESHFPQQEIRLSVERVANETANMARIFCEQRLVPKLPPYATTLFVAALPTFLLGIKTSTGALCDNLRVHFRWCTEGISQQRHIWPTSELAHAMVEAMISKAQVRDARGLIGESSAYVLGGFPPANQNLESRVRPCQINGMDLSEAASSNSLDNGSNRLRTPAEDALDWVSWLDFEDGLFSQLCNYSDNFPTDWN